MAQIDIGKLSFTHKGDYSSSTAYVLNDVVYYNGSAYIAKQSTTNNVPTNTTYWSNFAAGSGGIWNSGLSLGSANQLIRVNSGGSALEFHTPATVTSDFVLISEPADSAATTHNFSDVFTDTYQTFKATFSQWSSNNNPRFRFLTTGTSQLNGSSYDWSGMETGTNTSSGNYTNQFYGRNSDFCRLHSDNAGDSSSKRHYFDITFHNMRETADYPHMIVSHWGYSGSDWLEGNVYGARYRSATACGGFHLYNDNGGTQYIYDMKIYGIK